MPKTLTGNAEMFPNVQVPVAGEPRTGTSVETPFQQAADRTQYLKDRLDFIDSTKEGARRIRRVASLTALKALVDRPDKGFCFVDTHGLYQFDAASLAVSFDPIIVRPTDLATDGVAGRWLHATSGITGVAYGLARLGALGKILISSLTGGDAEERLAASAVRNGLVYVSNVSSAGPFFTTSPAFVDVTGAQVGLDLVIGDKVFITGQARASGTGTQTEHNTKWVAVKPDASVVAVPTSTLAQPVGGSIGNRILPVSVAYVAVATGTHILKMQQSSGESQDVRLSDVSLLAQVFRP